MRSPIKTPNLYTQEQADEMIDALERLVEDGCLNTETAEKLKNEIVRRTAKPKPTLH